MMTLLGIIIIILVMIGLTEVCISLFGVSDFYSLFILMEVIRAMGYCIGAMIEAMTDNS